MPHHTSSVRIEEITGQEFAEVQKPANKKKKNPIIDEAFCRRSGRIALISKGFKDKNAAEAVSKEDDSQEM